MINISIIGSGRVVEEHIKSAKKNNINILQIYSPNINSKNVKILSKKYKIFIARSFSDFLRYAKEKKSNFLIASRIVDNEFFLSKCLKIKKVKIFIEKPLFTNLHKYKKYMKFKNRVFVGYNRIFYKNIIFLKKKILNEKNLIVDCFCPESNKDRIKTNTSHIISIIHFLFKKIKLVWKKNIDKNYHLNFILDGNHYLNLNIGIKAVGNFSLSLINQNFNFLFRPIEKLKYYKSMDKYKFRNNNFYKPKYLSTFNEFKNNVKPGFQEQMLEFKNFCKGKKILNDIKFAYEVMKTSNMIK